MSDFLTRAQEFETPEDAMAHYGVKGMKWGVTRDNPSGSKPKPTKDEILDARSRLDGKNREFDKQRKEIMKDKTRSRFDRKQDVKNLRVSALADPDRMTALTLTKGEKALLAVLAVPAPYAVAGNLAVRADVKRQLRKAQAQEAYNKSR